MQIKILLQHLTFLLLLLSLAACHDDCIYYGDSQVDFFTEHPAFEVIPPVFEQVTEQVLIKPAHKVGATFELVAENYQTTQAYEYHEIQDSTVLHLVQNAETNKVAEVVCYDFYAEENFKTVEVPDTYQTRFWQKLVTDGTGTVVPAEYDVIHRQILKTPGQIIPRTDNNRKYHRVNFTSPSDQPFKIYLADQLNELPSCIDGRSYRIVE